MSAAITRRELLAGAAGTAVVVSVPGCKSIPGTEVVYLAAKGIGGAAGLVLNECGLSAEMRSALVSVVQAVMDATPGPGEGLTETWIGAAKRHIESLTAEGKVKPLVGAVALAAFAVVPGIKVQETVGTIAGENRGRDGEHHGEQHDQTNRLERHLAKPHDRDYTNEDDSRRPQIGLRDEQDEYGHDHQHDDLREEGPPVD